MKVDIPEECAKIFVKALDEEEEKRLQQKEREFDVEVEARYKSKAFVLPYQRMFHDSMIDKKAKRRVMLIETGLFFERFIPVQYRSLFRIIFYALMLLVPVLVMFLAFR